MRLVLISIIDLVLVAATVVIALFVRDDFAINPARLDLYLPYMMLSVASAVVVLPALGLHKRMWRFSSYQDYARVVCASFLIVAVAVSIGSVFGLLNGVARSIPVLHLMFMASLLVSARLAARSMRRYQEVSAAASVRADDAGTPAIESQLVLGVGPLAEVYLRSILQFERPHVRIVGIIGERNRHVGRVMFGYPVLGSIDEIDRILDELTVHAVHIDRIVVTAAVEDLAGETALSLLRLKAKNLVHIEWMDLLSPTLAGATVPAVQPSETVPETAGPAFVLSDDELAALRSRTYWSLKRVIDVVCSAVLLAVLAPVIALVWALVAVEFGQPVLFWQMRPGKGGRPFRLYKFRSMAGARDATGQRRSDKERTTAVGAFLRRTRLDELPQLVNILRGDMSFVGPRPLIQAEQTAAIAARLIVRPGLTGWAQVKGGRDISVDDKAALDIWYARNASFRRDFEIILRTIPMVVFGERVNADAIVDAWRELEMAGISRGRGAITTAERLSPTNRIAA